MTDNKNNDDIFLQSIGKVVPLKKNENIKPIKKITIKTNKETKIKTNKETKIKIKIKEKTVIKTTNFKIKSTPVEKNIKKVNLFAKRITENCLLKGLLVVYTGRESIKFGPPLTISKLALKKGLEILEKSIGSLWVFIRKKRI